MTEEQTGAPGLGRLAEASLLVLVWPNAVFGSLAKSPTPSYGAMITNILLFTIILFGINSLYFTSTYPTAMAAIGPLYMAASAAGGLVLAILGGIFAAAVIHIISRILGGKGSFERSFQVISLCAALAPLTGMVMFFAARVPLIWVLPTLMGVYITVAGVVHLHEASRAAAWALFASLGLGLLTLQWFGAAQLKKLSVRAKAMQAAAAQIQMMQGLPPAMPRFTPEQAKAVQQAAVQLQELRKQLRAMPTDSPSPDLRKMLPVVVGDISAPGDENAAVRVPQGAAPATERPTRKGQTPTMGVPTDDAMLKMGEMLLPLINNPAMLGSLPPAQAEPMKKLVAAMQKQHDALKSGRELSKKEEEEISRQMKEAGQALLKNLPMLMQQMGQGRQPPQGQK